MEKKRGANKRAKACWGASERGWLDFFFFFFFRKGWSDFASEKKVVFVMASL